MTGTSAVVVAVVTRGHRYIVICRHPDCGQPVRGVTVLATRRYPEAASVARGHEHAHTYGDGEGSA